MLQVTAEMSVYNGLKGIRRYIYIHHFPFVITQRGNDLMSPVRASAERLRGLPATLIVVAENDILRDEGEAMGRRLDEAGVEVTTVRFNGVVHDWGMLNGFAALHPTRTLIRLAGSVLRDYLKK